MKGDAENFEDLAETTVFLSYFKGSGANFRDQCNETRDRLKVGGVMRHDVAGRASIGREQCGLVRMFRS
jgi:hypothetical protein